MKNAFIFTSGMAVGAAGFAVFSVGLIGLGLIGMAIEINRMTTEATEEASTTIRHEYNTAKETENGA